MSRLAETDEVSAPAEPIKSPEPEPESAEAVSDGTPGTLSPAEPREASERESEGESLDGTQGMSSPTEPNESPTPEPVPETAPIPALAEPQPVPIPEPAEPQTEPIEEPMPGGYESQAFSSEE